MVAQYADACNIFDSPELGRKLDVLREHCERLGRDYDTIEKTAQVRFDLGPNGANVEATIEHLGELAELGIEVAHGTLARVSEPGVLEMMGEQRHPRRGGPVGRSAAVATIAGQREDGGMIRLILLLLAIWLVLAVIGFMIKGLLWLAVIGLVLFVATSVWGWFKRERA